MNRNLLSRWLGRASAAAIVASSPWLQADTKTTATHFDTVVKQLDIGGEQFSFFQEAPDAGNIGATLDAIMKSSPDAMSKLPPGLSLAKVFTTLGFGSIKAYGSSSVQEKDGVHRRAFYLIPGPKLGLTGALGENARPFLAAANPENADLALEFELDLRKTAQSLVSMAKEFLPPEEFKKLEEELNKPLPNAPLTGKQVMDNAALRLSLTAYLRPDDKIPVPNSPIEAPGVDAILAVDGLGWILNPLSGMILQGASEPGSPVEVKQDGKLILARFRQPVGPAPMDFQPAFEFDTESGRILIATRVPLMEALKGGKSKLGDSAEFKTTLTRLPSEGNVLLYLSSRFSQTAQRLVEANIKAQTPPDQQQMALSTQKLVLSRFLPSAPQVFVLSAVSNGIFMGSNSAIPPADPELTSLTTLAVLGGLAIPAFTSVQENAKITHQSNNARQVAISLKVYAGDHKGNYPEKLEQLIKEDIIEEANRDILNFVNPTSNLASPWIYNNGLTDSSPGTEILLLSPSASNGKRIAAYNDGSVNTITEEEAQKALSKMNQ